MTLPTGWTKTIVDCLLKQQGAVSYGILKPGKPHPEGVRMLRVMDIDENGLKGTEIFRVSTELANQYARTKLEAGDVLISVMGTVGRTLVVSEELAGANVNRALAVLKLSSAITPELLSYAFNTPTFKEKVEETKLGTAQKRINLADLRDFEMPLPPLKEQRRIVAKIEDLTARSQVAKRALDAIPPLLERFRQSVLAAAFRGDLTKQWRQQNPNTEPASELLKRIRQERRYRWEQDYLQIQKAKGKTPKDDKWKEKYQEPEPVDASDLPELPEGWCWATLEALSGFVTDGDHNPPKRKPEGIPHLTARNIRNWEVNYDKCTFISPADFEKVRKRYEPCPGDVIITCVGTVGETAIIPEGTVFSADRNLAAVRLLPGLAPEVLQFFLNSPVLTYRMHTSSGSTAQPHLYLTQLRAFPIPLPPIEEQAALKDLVNTRLQEMQTVVRGVEQSLILQTRLNQSILAKAFRGELVPQDLNDEPASALLERIRAEPKTTRPKTREKSLT